MADMDLARQLTHEYATKAANTSRMHPDPSITVKQLMERLSRFTVNRGSRDLFRSTDSLDKLKEADVPTKFAEELVALHDLFTDGLDVVKKRSPSEEENGYSIAVTSRCRSLFNTKGAARGPGRQDLFTIEMVTRFAKANSEQSFVVRTSTPTI